jgi:DNA-binding transcriptional LysR family regulator
LHRKLCQRLWSSRRYRRARHQKDTERHRDKAGLGVSILPEVAILPDHNVLGAGDGFPPIADTEVALVAAPEASAATRRLAEVLADFCSALDPRIAA